MVEPIMYLGIGFLIAALIGLGIVPLVHARAVRLTMKRLEASTPLSMAEIQADKDQLRAEFAMSARRLEMSVEQLKAKTTSQLAELGKKTDAINRLKIELGEKTAAIFALEAREKAFKDQLRATEEEFEVKTQALRNVERDLAGKEAEFARVSHELTDRSMVAESRQVELAALNAQVESLKAQVEAAELEHSQVQEKLAREKTQHQAVSEELGAARDRGNNLTTRVGELEAQLTIQTKEAEVQGSRIGDLESRLSTQGKILAEREYESNLLRQQAELGNKTERELRAALADTTDNTKLTIDRLRSEKAELEKQLEAVRRDMAAAIAQAQASWTTERTENALLRERINDIAAEVARLAVQLEGPDSPIETILAAGTPSGPSGKKASAKTANGTTANGTGGAPELQGTLAERIKALQGHASRAGQRGS
jgi:chromosome segregation ATPase